MVTPDDLRRAADLICSGKLVAFPTETVYGLGANAFDAEAVSRIYEAKGRPATSPLIVHVADVPMARLVVASWPEIADKLASRFWPGPLTMVLSKREVIPDIVTAGLGSVGVRVPAHPVALELIRLAGVPIAAPSANCFMQLSPTTAEHVRAGLGERVDLVLDGGPTEVGIESTVVSLTGTLPVILRPGMIWPQDLETASGSSWAPFDGVSLSVSPGLHWRHYAPRTPFFILEVGAPHPPGRGLIVAMPANPKEYAAVLYARLHVADGEGWDWIAVHPPGTSPEWDGIQDRLLRASR